VAARKAAQSLYARARRLSLRARVAQRRRDHRRSRAGRMLTALVCCAAGFMVITSTLHSRGFDLRPGRNTDLVSLVQAQSRRNLALSRTVTGLRQQVDRLTAAVSDEPDVAPEMAKRSEEAGFGPVVGPALTVTLDDAPDTVAADGIEGDLLVVHQQDIQAVVNALWAGGAEAMTIQGQRVISTTGVKCVGNTVVLHGVPYAPPYQISAIGDAERLRGALDGSESIRIYKQYVEAYGLGYAVSTSRRVTFPAHEGALELQHARVHTGDKSPGGTPR
jgi:uncharacterized protein YlxW (UPF0749 family)